MTLSNLRGLALALSISTLIAGCGDDVTPAPTADAAADRTTADVTADVTVDVSVDVTADVTADVATDLGIPIACSELGHYCHEVASGSAELGECHEGGHDADPAWCVANAARCYRLCTDARNAAADAGADGSTATDAAHNHDAATDSATATDAAHEHDAATDSATATDAAHMH